MVQGYLNAKKALPPEVFAAVFEAVGGKPTFLWVPGRPSDSRSRRNAYVLHLTEEGFTAESIASQLFISVRQVRRILAAERAASLPSAPAPGQPQSKPDLRKKEK